MKMERINKHKIQCVNSMLTHHISMWKQNYTECVFGIQCSQSNMEQIRYSPKLFENNVRKLKTLFSFFLGAVGFLPHLSPTNLFHLRSYFLFIRRNHQFWYKVSRFMTSNNINLTRHSGRSHHWSDFEGFSINVDRSDFSLLTYRK